MRLASKQKENEKSESHDITVISLLWCVGILYPLIVHTAFLRLLPLKISIYDHYKHFNKKRTQINKLCYMPGKSKAKTHACRFQLLHYYLVYMRQLLNP